MRWSPVFAGLILAGCSLGADPLTPPRLEAENAPSITALAGKIQNVFGAVKLSGYPRVSQFRKAPVTALADWMVCLRSDAETDSHVYALLILGNEIVDYRLALMIDECANERFEPLPAALPPAPHDLPPLHGRMDRNRS
jgi:hypothetical protein